MEVNETIRAIAQIASIIGDITVIVGFVALLIRPVRERLLGLGLIKDGMMWLLASEIRKIYYRNLEDKQLRQYEYETMRFCYGAYKALGGNSFIKHIVEEMETWTVVQ